METKQSNDAKPQVEDHAGGSETRAGSQSTSSDKKNAKRSKRSIREMVIDNNERFAATMKSLGE